MSGARCTNADKAGGKTVPLKTGTNMYDMTRETTTKFRAPVSYMKKCGVSADSAQWVRRTTTSEFRVPESYVKKCGISADSAQWIGQSSSWLCERV